MHPLRLVLTVCILCGAPPALAGGFCAGDRARLELRFERLGTELGRRLDQLVRTGHRVLWALPALAHRALLWDEYLQSRAALLRVLSEESLTSQAAIQAIEAPWLRARHLRWVGDGLEEADARAAAELATHLAVFTFAICQALKTGAPGACAPLGQIDVEVQSSCSKLRTSVRTLGASCRTPLAHRLLAVRGFLHRACMGFPGCDLLFYTLADSRTALCEALERDNEAPCHNPGLLRANAEACFQGLSVDRYLRGDLEETEFVQRHHDGLVLPGLRAARSPGDCLPASLREFDAHSRSFFGLEFPFGSPSKAIGG